MSKSNELLTKIYTTKLRLKSALGTSSDDICSYPTLIYNFFVNIWNNNYPTGYDNGYTEAYQVIAGTAPTQEHTLIERRTLREYTSNIPTVTEYRDNRLITDLTSIMASVFNSRLEMKDELFTTSDSFIIYPDLLNYLILHAGIFGRLGYDDGWDEACENLSTNRPSSPTISFSDNTITLSGSGTIMYSLDGENFSEYSSPIRISSDTFISSYCVVNNIPSQTVYMFCAYDSGEEPYVPTAPSISFKNNVISISSSEENGIIKYSFDGVSYSTYSTPITISEDKIVYAKVVVNGIDSNVVSRYCQYNSGGGGGGTEEVLAPNITFSNNTITISNPNSGGVIYYSFDGENFSAYSTSITINSDKTVYSYVTLNGVQSNTVSKYCQYNSGGGGGGTEIPDAPTISYSNNTITLSGSGNIKYSFDGVNYTPYSGPISITGSKTIYAYTTVNGVNSNVVNRYCEYVPPAPLVVNAPTISYGNNTITITSNQPGVFLWYSFDGTNYNAYTAPITIIESKTVYAKAVLEDVTSEIVSRYCQYDGTPSVNDPLIFDIVSNGTITWTNDPTPSYLSRSTFLAISYSINNGTLVNVSSPTTFSVSSGDVVRIYGHPIRGEYFYNTYTSNHFSTTCRFNVRGNIMSMTNHIGFGSGDFYQVCAHLFEGCTNLLNANNLTLPATTIEMNEYDSMFKGCTSLVYPPVTLPATVLGERCYQSMFEGCTSLVSCPSISATTLTAYCCQNMFNGCTSLASACALPATTLATYCYAWMFYGCSSLVQVPALPATTLATYCYYSMFANCTSIKIGPVLRATVLTDYCYYDMFYGCTALECIKILASYNINDNNIHNMVYGTGSGTLDCVIGTGSIYRNLIPSVWIIREVSEYDENYPPYTPAPPTITVNGEWVTLSSPDVGSVIYYSWNGSNYSVYTSNISNSSFYCYTELNGIRSEIIHYTPS